VAQAQDDPDVRRVVAGNPGPLTGPGTNTWILGRGAVAVIDPGPPDDPAHVAAVLAALHPDERIAMILVTHAHLDHCGAAAALARIAGVEVCAHAPVRAAQADGVIGDGTHGPFRPDRALSEGETLRLGSQDLQVLHVPGHHPGHLAFRVGATVFTGDTVMGWASTLIAPPDGRMADWRASVVRLRDLGTARFLPGHGDPVTDPAGRANALLRHRAGREGAVLDALRAGPAPLADLVARVYADTPAALHRAAAANLLAHLLDLAERGLVAPRPTPGGADTWSLTPAAHHPVSGSGQPGTVWL
jgi:hydroxyacylglutathione hydrolase